MKFYHYLLASGLLTGIPARAQTTSPLPPLRAVLDTVAVTGTTRVLTLAIAPGPEVITLSLTPTRKFAVLHTPPAGPHEYDLTGIRVLVSKEFNRSNTGLMLLNLALPDSSTQAPSAHLLLPAPIAVTDREVRRAKDGILTLDVRAYHITLPAKGLFVIAEGAPEPPYQFLGDTLFADRSLGKRMPTMHVRLVSPATPQKQRLVNSMDFISVRGIRTTVQPQTWHYVRRKGIWQQRPLIHPNCPQCVVSNAGLELVVREL